MLQKTILLGFLTLFSDEKCTVSLKVLVLYLPHSYKSYAMEININAFKIQHKKDKKISFLPKRYFPPLPFQTSAMSSLEVQPMSCALILEKVGSVTTKEALKKAELSLARNEFKYRNRKRSINLKPKKRTFSLICRIRELLLVVDSAGHRRRKFLLRSDRMTVHRRFASEGKLTVTLGDLGVRLLLSNAPPHRLAVFAKCMAAKLAGGQENKGAEKTGPTPRQRLLSNLQSAVDEIR